VIWTADLIKARFVEAADTERRLPAARISPSVASGWWPEFKYSVADMNGWGGRRLSEHREQFWANARLAPSAGAVSRHEEVLTWTADHIHDEARRRLAWLWAFCTAADRDFSAALRSKGIARSTAYDRLNKLWARLERDFRNATVPLRFPDDKWVGHEPHRSKIVCGIIGRESDNAPPVSRTHWKDDEATEDRPDLRDFSWAQKQAAREAKRRKALGMSRP